MVRKKILTYGIANLGDIIRALISGGVSKKITVKYADGSAMEANVSVVKMDVALDKSQVRLTAESVNFPEVETPTEVGIIAETEDLPSVEIV